LVRSLDKHLKCSLPGPNQGTANTYMLNKNKDEFYRTNDLSLVTTICYFGGQIEKIEKPAPHKALFYIKKDVGLDNIVLGFQSRSLQVEPWALFHSYKKVKNQLFPRTK